MGKRKTKENAGSSGARRLPPSTITAGEWSGICPVLKTSKLSIALLHWVVLRLFFFPGVFVAQNSNLFKEAMARGSSNNRSNSSSSSSSSSRNREEIGEQRSIMACLTDDTLLEVLRHLPTRYLLHAVALVCRRWRRLCESRLV